jgi:NosR/NirI family transcriptional regulator, nitrous oxide reductase regulator
LIVYDAKGERVGYVVRTSPAADKITGYSGPTDTMVVLDAGGKVAGIRIRSSWDTKEHVRDVRENEYFMSLWNGKTWEQVAAVSPREAGVEGVSGASLTSMAIANGIHHRFKSAEQQAKLPRVRAGVHDVGLVLVLAVALVFSFTELRGRTWARRLFQVVLIGYVGFWNGQLLAQSLFGGWAASTPAWRMAPGLVLLAAAAFIFPWASRRAVYCSQFCPHGAAQELVGRLGKRKLRLGGGAERGMRWLPPGLVLVVIVVMMLNLPLDLAGIEPFDAYLIRTAGVATIVIAVVGLVAAAFVPMAYCKYGCPTGMVLQYVRSHGKADSFGRRDLVAGLLVVAAAGMYLRYDLIHRWIYG